MLTKKNPEAETGDSRDVEAATAEFLAPRDNRLDRGSRLRDDEPSQLGNFEANNEREENFEGPPSGSNTQAGGFLFFLIGIGYLAGLCAGFFFPPPEGEVLFFFKGREYGDGFGSPLEKWGVSAMYTIYFCMFIKPHSFYQTSTLPCSKYCKIYIYTAESTQSKTMRIVTQDDTSKG